MRTGKYNPIVFPIAVGPAIAAGVTVLHAVEAHYGVTLGLLAGMAQSALVALVIAYPLNYAINRFTKSAR